MADTAATPARMTRRQFLDWEARQPLRHEFEDGLIYLMAGGTKAHGRVKGNIFAALHARLRGQPCQPYGSDLKVLTAPGAIYYPDITVDCGTYDGEASLAETPTVIFEVLSKTTREDDLVRKLPNYQATPSVQEIFFVETNRLLVLVWRRSPSGWEESELARPDAPLEINTLGVTLSFEDIYAGLAFA